MKNIVLTGFMATGKTSISQKLSELTGMEVYDTDKIIENEQGITINKIFEQFGEEYFRKLETAAIKKISKLDGVIISTGGGAVLKNDNMEMLRQNGIIFNLSPSFETIKERLCEARATRPLLKDDEVENIKKRFMDRIPYYNNCDYKIIVSNDKMPIDFAKEIIKKLEK